MKQYMINTNLVIWALFVSADSLYCELIDCKYTNNYRFHQEMFNFFLFLCLWFAQSTDNFHGPVVCGNLKRPRGISIGRGRRAWRGSFDSARVR